MVWPVCSFHLIVSRAVHLIIDSTKIAFGFRLVMLRVAYRRRNLPIAWVWAIGTRGHTTTDVQIALLTYVRKLLPIGVRTSLVGGSEFGWSLLIAQLRDWGWDYALRQPGDHLLWWQGNGQWQRLASLLDVPGCRWLGWTWLTQSHDQLTHLAVYWRKGEKQPWFLATIQRTVRATVRLYHRRMWIEQVFADLKGHGFDLESSHLRSFLCLGRLTLIVYLLFGRWSSGRNPPSDWFSGSPWSPWLKYLSPGMGFCWVLFSPLWPHSSYSAFEPLFSVR